MPALDVIKNLFIKKTLKLKPPIPNIVECGCKDKEIYDVRVFTSDIEKNFSAKYCKDHIKTEVEKGNLVAL